MTKAGSWVYMYSMEKVAVVVASTGKNLELAQEIAKQASERGFQAKVYDVVAMKLPLYTSGADKSDGIPQPILDILVELQATKKFFFLAPEYNGGLPPTFTNFFAWASVATKDWRETFNEKTAVIGTHSGGGGLHALMAMRIQLAYVGMNVLGRQIHTHFQKPLNQEALDMVFEELKR